MCVGQKCGNKAAIHALGAIYEEDTTDGVLLVNASIAFNCLNRKAALANINNLCPALGTVLTNTYRSEPKLFIGGECIPSREGTTQGDPLAMAMYAMATLPLIQSLHREAEVEQIWFADDSAAGGNVNVLRIGGIGLFRKAQLSDIMSTLKRLACCERRPVWECSKIF